MLEGEEGNGPKEIHDAGDFRAFCINNGHHCLVVAGETYLPITPGGLPDGTS